MLSNETKDLIKDTIPILREHGITLTDHFYKRMFQHNPELKQIFNKAHNEAGKQQHALAMAVLGYAENIDNPGILAPVLNRIAHKHTSLGIRAEHYPIVGKHLLASIKEVLGDAASDQLITAWGAAYQQLADVLIQAENQLYLDSATQLGGWTGWRAFTISDKVKESDEITSFYLSPADKGPLPVFQPGQYISVRVFVPEWNLPQPRQYSLSDAPNNHYLRISVKREPGNDRSPAGRVSNILHHDYQVGDTLDIAPPFGDFHLDTNKQTPVVLISGGVGITPMMSMLNQITTSGQTRRVEFIHGCRNENVLAFGPQLSEVAQQHAHINLHLFHEHTAASNPYSAHIGRVALAPLRDNITLPEADYYVCGPIGFMQNQIQSLHDLGIPSGRIHAEAFGTGGVSV